MLLFAVAVRMGGHDQKVIRQYCTDHRLFLGTQLHSDLSHKLVKEFSLLLVDREHEKRPGDSSLWVEGSGWASGTLWGVLQGFPCKRSNQ